MRQGLCIQSTVTYHLSGDSGAPSEEEVLSYGQTPGQPEKAEPRPCKVRSSLLKESFQSWATPLIFHRFCVACASIVTVVGHS